MKPLQLIIFSILTTLAMGLFAQEKARPVQLSFFYPLATNGLESPQYTNTFSFNLLYGYNGGVDGLEIGGILNMTRGNVRGLQLAGFANSVHGELQGVQAAGFANVLIKQQQGMQIAGLTNVTIGDIDGAQLAGFSNIAVRSVKGLQIAGFLNSTVLNTDGIQLAGFANFTRGRMTGLQAAGFLNYAHHMRGVQIGFINVADSVEQGTPIGFLSWVNKGGYRTMELSGDETFYGGVKIKTGVRKFYNIFAAGIQVQSDDINWGVGYGIGTAWNWNDRWESNVDLIAYHISEGESWTDELNLLNRLHFNVGYRLGANTVLFGGVSFNALVSQLDRGEEIGSSIAPWTMFDRTYNGQTRVQLYPGFQVGLRL